MIVSDNTIQAEGLGDFFENLGKKGFNVSKTLTENAPKTLHELWTLQRTLPQQLLLEIPKIECQHYLK